MKLAETLRGLMKARGITIDALAKATNIAPSTIKTWLGGRAPRNLADVRVVAEYLGTSFEFLVFGEVRTEQGGLQAHLMEDVFEGYLKVKIERVIPSSRKRG